MKRKGFLYEKMLDKNFIRSVVMRAAKNKKKRKEVEKALLNINEVVDNIYDMIKNEGINLSPVKHKTIKERRKERDITISPFEPNQILDYMLVEIIQPIVNKSMYRYCIGNVEERGVTCGLKVVKKMHSQYAYFIKLDIRHFYPSIDTEILLKLFSKKIKDTKFLNFMSQVISENGLPIGCFYSQVCSNFYLCEFDHYVKEVLRVPGYVRYVDDMVIYGNNKKQLLSAAYRMQKYLNQKLCVEFKYRPIVRSTVKFPLSFLGFKFYKDKVLLRPHIFYKILRLTKKINVHVSYCLAKSFMAYNSWLQSTEGLRDFYRRVILKDINLRRIKKIISEGDRKKNGKATHKRKSGNVSGTST